MNVSNFGYRAGFNIYLSGAVLKLAPLPDEWSIRIMEAVVAARNPLAHFISTDNSAIGLGRLSEPHVFALLAESLFDMTWFRYMGEKHEHFSFYSLHPEFTKVSLCRGRAKLML